MPRNWTYGHKRDSGYRSKAEENLASYLKEKKIGFSYETLSLSYEKTVKRGLCKSCGQKKVVKLATYTPDFILENGVIIEYKGRFTSADRAKILAVRKSNPDDKVYLLFGSDNRLSKSSSKRYSDWAISNGFDYAIKLPPSRWLRTTTG